MSKYRDRIHCLLLYPDNESHCNAMSLIEKSYDYASVLHDRDIVSDGQFKKSHWHVVIRFGQARWSTAICKELGIEENYIEKARSFNNALLYLIHFNDSDKTQYDIDEVKGTLKTRLIQELSKVNKTESEKIIELFDFIDSLNEPLTMSEFARHCAIMGYWSEFRRAGSIFSRVLDEHNQRYGKFYDIE